MDDEKRVEKNHKDATSNKNNPFSFSYKWVVSYTN